MFRKIQLFYIIQKQTTLCIFLLLWITAYLKRKKCENTFFKFIHLKLYIFSQGKKIQDILFWQKIKLRTELWKFPPHMRKEIHSSLHFCYNNAASHMFLTFTFICSLNEGNKPLFFLRCSYRSKLSISQLREKGRLIFALPGRSWKTRNRPEVGMAMAGA